MSTLSPNAAAVLACPYCRRRLSGDGPFFCRNCGDSFPAGVDGRPDFRLTRPATVNLPITLPGPLPEAFYRDWPALAPIRPSPAHQGLPEVDHLDRELIHRLPPADRPGALALDLGCGSGLNRPILEALGYEYLGLDYDAAEAPLLGDAHRLPFLDDSFDLIVSIAVLEHLRYPLLAVSEAARTLKPGRWFMGSAAFLEPFHDSFHHHSHFGLINLLASAGLTVEWIAPSRGWNGLTAQAKMALFPKAPKSLAKALVLPLAALSRAWRRALFRRVPRARPAKHALATTGSFYFAARR